MSKPLRLSRPEIKAERMEREIRQLTKLPRALTRIDGVLAGRMYILHWSAIHPASGAGTILRTRDWDRYLKVLTRVLELRTVSPKPAACAFRPAVKRRAAHAG